MAATPAAIAQSRPLLLAVLVTGIAVLFFGIACYVAGTLLQPAPVWPGSLCTWDCPWYQSIAEQGYQRVPNPGSVSANFGFFPAFPLGAALLMRLTGAPFVAAGLLLNVVFSAAFCWIALRHRTELLLKDNWAAAAFLFAFLLSPWSLYNRIPYTEMLFNLAALGTFAFWRRGNYWAAAAFGIVLTATRAAGIVLPLVLLVELLLRDRQKTVAVLLRPDARFRALAVMPFGLMAFMVFLYIHVGDPLAYFHVQAVGWGQGLRNPVATLLAAGGFGLENRYGVIALLVASGVLVGGLLLRRIPVALAAFAWLTPALSLASVLSGEPRYALSLFPLYLLVPAVPRVVQLVVILTLAAGQMAFVYLWLHGSVIMM